MPKNTAQGAPTALVVGLSHPLASPLSKSLSARGIVVVGVQPDKKTKIESQESIIRSEKEAVDQTYDYVVGLVNHTTKKQCELIFNSKASDSRKVLVVAQFPGAGTTPEMFEKINQSQLKHRTLSPASTDLNALLQTPLRQSKTKPNTQTLLLRDFFGGQSYTVPVNQVQLLFSGIPSGQIIILGNQARLISPLYETDAIEAIVAHLLSKFPKNSVWEVRGQRSIPLINMAFIIEKLLQKQFDFMPTMHTIPSSIKEESTIDATQLPLNQHVTLEKGIQLALETIDKSHEIPINSSKLIKQPVKTEPRESVKKRPKSESKLVSKKPLHQPKKSFFKRGKLLLSLALLFSIMTVFAPFVGQYVFLKRVHNLHQAQPNPEVVQGTLHYNALLHKVNSFFVSLLRPLPISASHQVFSYPSMQYQANELAVYHAAIHTELKQLFSLVLDQEKGSVEKAVSSMQGYVDQSIEVINRLQMSLKSTNGVGFVFTNLELSQLHQSKKKLYALRLINLSFRELLTVKPQTNWVVILQDVNELRPTGGYLDSIVLISLDQGKIINTEFLRTETLDAQLEGTVEPPVELAQHLKQTRWYLRDANWDPDFPSTASTVAWFLDKQRDLDVDGVISLDSTFLAQILQEVGEVKLDDATVVTADNFETYLYNNASKQADTTANKTFFLEVAQALFSKVSSESNLPADNLLEDIYQGFQEKHLQMYVENSSFPRALNELSWSGELIQPQCPVQFQGKQCVSDYINYNEANIGINKANRFITRKHRHQVSLTQSTILHMHQVTISNEATQTNWPAGAYQALVRLYLPANSVVGQVQLAGEVVSDEVYAVSAEHQKTVVSIPIEVGVGEEQNLKIEYQLEKPFTLEENAVYTLLFQKQAGTGADPYRLSLKLPENVEPKTVSHPVDLIGNELEHLGDLEQNHFFAVELEKNI